FLWSHSCRCATAGMMKTGMIALGGDRCTSNRVRCRGALSRFGTHRLRAWGARAFRPSLRGAIAGDPSRSPPHCFRSRCLGRKKKKRRKRKHPATTTCEEKKKRGRPRQVPTTTSKTFRLPTDLVERLETAADLRGKGVTDVVRELLEAQIESYIAESLRW